MINEAKLWKLVKKWRSDSAHAYASENTNYYTGFDDGMLRCADELEALLNALAASLTTDVTCKREEL